MVRTGFIDAAGLSALETSSILPALCPSCSDTIYAHLGGPDKADLALLDLLGSVYGNLARYAPQCHLIPLLKCSGWEEGDLKGAKDADAVFCAERSSDAQQLTIRVSQRARNNGAPAWEPLSEQLRGPLDDCVLAGAKVIGASAKGGLAFEHVALGGTFDRLHAGHRLLLSAAAAITTEAIYVGVTDGKLLDNKKYRDLIQPYDERCDVIRNFIGDVRPSLDVTLMCLSDPNEPTRAETEAHMQALVASEETLPGALKINKGREAKGFEPLVIVVVPVIGAMMSEDEKLSSTALRQKDAESADGATL